MEKSIKQLKEENHELLMKLKTYANFIKNNHLALNVDVPLNLEQLQILIELVAERSGNI